MSDQTLVPIPWQPEYFLTPHTLAILEDASRRLGHNIIVVDAWRSKATQQGYWDAYQAYLNGTGPWAPTASNPENGQRNHMRGAAWDARDTDPATQAACRAAGAIRDAAENWHWNDPQWVSMPIIPTNTTTAGGGSTPIPSPEEDDMKGKFLRAPDTSMGYIGPDGILVPLKDMDEVRSYEYIGWASQSETMPVSSLVWQKLNGIAVRTNAAK
jgi:hypothetical protein